MSIDNKTLTDLINVGNQLWEKHNDAIKTVLEEICDEKFGTVEGVEEKKEIEWILIEDEKYCNDTSFMISKNPTNTLDQCKALCTNDCFEIAFDQISNNCELWKADC